VPAQYILAVLAAAFLIAGALRRMTGGPGPQARTWLLVGAIFAAVSLWLFTRP
jgi:NO-binding membrane sensor protein with MHYT domain